MRLTVVETENVRLVTQCSREDCVSDWSKQILVQILNHHSAESDPRAAQFSLQSVTVYKVLLHKNRKARLGTLLQKCFLVFMKNHRSQFFYFIADRFF